VSILGIAPHLDAAYVDLMWVGILTFIIGLILSSAFSAIVGICTGADARHVVRYRDCFFGFASHRRHRGCVLAASLTAMGSNSSIESVLTCRCWDLVAAFLPNIEHRKIDQQLITRS